LLPHHPETEHPESYDVKHLKNTLSISKAATRGSKDAPTNLNVKKFMINPGTDKNLHRVRGWIFFPLRIEFETRNFEIENRPFFANKSISKQNSRLCK
jgi:hypothetical protein